MFGEIKTVTGRIPSGSGMMVSGFNLQGYRNYALWVPVITSGAIAFAAPTTGDAFSLFRDAAGAQKSAATPGGTGGTWLGNDVLSFLAGYSGPVHLSGAQQQADRDFVLRLKG